jgi:hypothetical protein
MAYYPHGVQLSMPQMKSLKKGSSVKLSAANLSGPHMLHLTKLQSNRIQRAMTKGCGMTVGLSAKQLAHHKKMGGGWFDSILNTADRLYQSPIVRDLGSLAGKHIMKKLGSGLDDFCDDIEQEHGPMMRQRVEDHIHGSGFWDTLKDIVSNPIVQDIGKFGINQGLKFLGGNVGGALIKHRKATCGGSFR